MRMNRCTDNPLDAIGGGRLEKQLPASALKLLRKMFRVCTRAGSLVLEPLCQRFAIGDGRLPKTQQIANFGPVPLVTPAGQGKLEIIRSRKLQFRDDVVDQGAVDFG